MMLLSEKATDFLPDFLSPEVLLEKQFTPDLIFLLLPVLPREQKKRERGKSRRMVEEKLAHLTKKAFHSFRAIIEALFLPNITLFVSSINMTAPLAYCCCCWLWKPIVITHLKTKCFPHSSIIQC